MSAEHEGLGPDPYAIFEAWFQDIQKTGKLEQPNAMTLATATKDGAPSARIVLLKAVVDGAFQFFTNYESRKAQELIENPRASLVFFWEALNREVRVEGTVEKVSRGESENYFRTRPRESQLGAWASKQSTELSGGRSQLLSLYDECEARYRGKDVPCPPHWGGFKLVPTSIEFWVGQPGRLHDRYLYRRHGGAWAWVRLSP